MRITESEDRLQMDSKRYLDVALPSDAIAWHTPNGGHRSKAVAGKMKAFGVLSGVPDWIILWQGRVLFLELKNQARIANAVPARISRRCEGAGLPASCMPLASRN